MTTNDNDVQIDVDQFISSLETELVTVTKKQYMVAKMIVKLYRSQQKQRPKLPRTDKQLEALRMGRRKNPKLAKLYKKDDDSILS